MALWSVIPTLARTHPGKSSNGNQKQQSRRLPRFPTLQVIGKLTEWGVLDQSDNKTVDFSWLLGYDLSASDVLLDDGLGNYPLHILCFHFLKCSWEQAHLLVWVFEKMPVPEAPSWQSGSMSPMSLPPKSLPTNVQPWARFPSSPARLVRQRRLWSVFGLLLLLEAGRSQIISTQAPTQPLATMSATCAEKRGVDLESGMTLYKEFPKLYYNVSLSGDKHVSIYI